MKTIIIEIRTQNKNERRLVGATPISVCQLNLLRIISFCGIYHYLPLEGASGSIKTKKNSKGVPKKKQNLKKIKFFFDHLKISKNSF